MHTVGGLNTAIHNECHTFPNPFFILAPESKPATIGNGKIIPVDLKIPFGEIDVTSRQVLCGGWQLLHPDAFLPPAFSDDVERQVFLASQTPVKTLSDFIAFVESQMERGRVKEEFYNQSWGPGLEALPSGSNVHWQEFFLAPAMHRYAENLRGKGCSQSFHLHEPVPDSLHRSSWGRSLLGAISKMDRAYFHTDRYCERVCEQLEQLQLPIPEVLRFDLGINQKKIEADLERIEAALQASQDFSKALPGWESLDDTQQKFITEVLNSRANVPHRFICIDRVDPIKGTTILVEAIEQFLEEQLAKGSSLAELAEQYRFFFLQDPPSDYGFADPHHLNTHYHRVATNQRVTRLERRFPGIVFSSSPLSGVHRAILPSLLLGCTIISASIQEGLNLAIMEGAYVNTLAKFLSDCSVILGSNAGFALQCALGNFAMNAFFPLSGSVLAMKRSIEQVVNTRRSKPGELRRLLELLVQAEIIERTASLLA